MIRSSSNLSQHDHASIYLRIAISEYANNSYENALENLEKSQEIIGKMSRSNDEINFCFRLSYTDDTELSPMPFLINIGLVYRQNE
ncbi:unnamed protein product [Rotaria sp. Silwood2]|nr:unnamed protein product [Rotaria sp. Silwood2]CAF3304185.1 unnamed protein product [Rotaria sp. Silwood2]CAF4130488.1 unnamed protein product [Rotaria sp. Silwood2]CAF4193763.1 unnamed protein product [Rotaria sp. Silwood2]